MRVELKLPLDGDRAAPGVRIDDLPAQEREGLAVVAVPMTAEERRKVRRRLRLAPDLEIALALPTGTRLDPGTLLHRRDGSAFVVAAADEEVLVATPRTPREGIEIAHLLGNLHRDIDLAGGDIATLYEAAVEGLLRRKGFAAARARRPFLGRPPGPEAHPVRG